jgi:uncharacterized protein YaaR (DUF327 family)
VSVEEKIFMINWKNIILTFKEQSIAHFKTKVTKFVKISENEAVKNISNDSNQAQNKTPVLRVIKTFDYL